MRIAIVQYETRDNEDLNMLMDRNRIYAHKHNYDYILRRDPYRDLPPYWAKVRMLQEVFDNNNYDAVLMLDSDACIHDHDTKVEDILNKYPNKSFLYSPDCPVWDGVFNAGVVLVSNPHGPQIIQDWMSLYNPERWTLDDSKATWTCQGNWAGIDYEQGAFAHHMIENNEYRLKRYLQEVPSVFFQGPFAKDRYLGPQFSIHFAGSEHKGLMKQYIKDPRFMERYCRHRNWIWIWIVVLVLVALFGFAIVHIAKVAQPKARSWQRPVRRMIV